jgi:transposase
MEIAYPVCCGVDVHKKFIVATIIKTTNQLKAEYIKERFSTFNNSILKFKAWLIEHNCYDVCMESTGKYWIPVYNLLEDTIRVTVANPKWVKTVKGNKDDVKDSRWIGDMFRIGLVPGSYIPNKLIRVLREFTRYRAKLIGNKSSEKNRFQNAFTVCNIALDSVVSDMFGKSASLITDYLLKSDDEFDPEYCKSLLQKSLKKKADEVIESIEGYQMTSDQKNRMLIVKDHLAYLVKTIEKIDMMLDEMIKPYESAITLLCTIPGIDRASAITIISEIGTDMSLFSSSKRLCCWAGLTPGNNSSAGKKKSVRITRAGIYIKPALVQVAHAAVKSNVSDYYRIKYERISTRRGKKRAIIAIARMILTAVFHMFTTGEIWNPADLFKIDMPIELKEKQKQKQINLAIKFLLNNGVISPDSLIAAKAT